MYTFVPWQPLVVIGICSLSYFLFWEVIWFFYLVNADEYYIEKQEGGREEFFKHVGMCMKNFKDVKQMQRGGEVANLKPFNRDIFF